MKKLKKIENVNEQNILLKKCHKQAAMGDAEAPPQNFLMQKL